MPMTWLLLRTNKYRYLSVLFGERIHYVLNTRLVSKEKVGASNEELGLLHHFLVMSYSELLSILL